MAFAFAFSFSDFADFFPFAFVLSFASLVDTVFDADFAFHSSMQMQSVHFLSQWANFLRRVLIDPQLIL